MLIDSIYHFEHFDGRFDIPLRTFFFATLFPRLVRMICGIVFTARALFGGLG